MRICLLLATMALLAACGRPQGESRAFATGIVGGTNVKAGDRFAKSTVLVIDYDRGDDCSGTLIGENLVLTAGHCVEGGTRSLRIVFADHRTLQSDLVRTAVAIRRHEFYKLPGGDRNDIALVLFAGRSLAGYRPALLPTEDITGGSTVTVLGYGTTHGRRGPFAVNDSGTLREVSLVVQHVLPTGLEFTVDQKNGRGVCFGDSGGPAFTLNAQGEPVVAGFAIDVFTPGMQSHPAENYDYCGALSLSTNVFAYRDWIGEATNDLMKLKTKPASKRAAEASAQIP